MQNVNRGGYRGGLRGGVQQGPNRGGGGGGAPPGYGQRNPLPHNTNASIPSATTASSNNRDGRGFGAQGAHSRGGHNPQANNQGGRGRGGQPGEGHYHRGGGGPPHQGAAVQPPPPSTTDAREFLKRLSKDMPLCAVCTDVARQLLGRFGRGAITQIIDAPHSSHQESQLLWLFSQPLFGGIVRRSELCSHYQLAEQDVVGASNLVVSYFGSAAFSRDKIAYACMMRSEEEILRYLIVFRSIRTLDVSLITNRYDDLESLAVLERLLTRASQHVQNTPSSASYANLGIPSEPRQLLLEEYGILMQTVAERKRALAAPQPRRRRNVGNQPQRPPRQDDDDDAEYEQGYSVRRQEIAFQPTYQATTVEPTLEELKRELDDPADLERARRITFGAPIDSFPHHADAVFHTTRYDALQPLREGIQRLLDNDFKPPRKGEAPLQVKVLFDLRVVDVDGSPEYGPVFVFHSQTLKEMCARNKSLSKRRLLPGSLVVITHDQLETGEVCTVVSLQKTYPIDKGYICLRRAESLASLRAEADDSSNVALGPLKNIHAQYAILESTVYWETHVHSLKALQNLDANDPLFNQIRSLPAPPIPQNLPWKRFEDLDQGRVANFTFDRTQAEAFRHVFSSAAPVIQGPPGTGKSYIGVCAVRTMLHERIHEEGPILVVCYTNHALDSFLEDLIKLEPALFEDEGQQNLVRLGYRSKSDVLQNYFLKHNNTGIARFYHSRDELRECWDFATSDNFVPQEDLMIPPEVVHFFSTLKRSKQQAFDAAESDLAQAKNHYEATGSSVPADKIETLKLAFDSLKDQRDVPKLRDATLDSTRRAFLKYANENMLVHTALIDLDEYSNELLEFAQGKQTEAQRLALQWVKEAQVARDKADRDLKNFMTIWRDAKGTPRQQLNVVAAAPAIEAEDDTIPDDVDEENQDRLLDQPMEDQGGGAARNRIPREEHGIQLVEVERPAFMDAPGEINFNALSAEQRHALYFYLKDHRTRKYLPAVASHIISVGQEANRHRADINESNKTALRKAKVIGATTTGLARYLLMLSSLNIRCVILEEAAEIPECHALAAIIPGVKHFIQVGDHQQLRPKIASIENHKRNLDISMMERMLSVNNSCKTLATQRRMRPQIADFIRPLYEKKLAAVNAQLTDHDNVLRYPQDPVSYGLASGHGFVRYIQHNFPETAAPNGTSFENRKEAEFAVALTWYLTKQSPNATITLLVPYTGQVLYTQQVARTNEYRSILGSKDAPGPRLVRIVSIDDFQGEESDVVILCLTRSVRPGFMRQNNRICVALSRARHLQIVVGNFKCFENVQNSYWPSVLRLARALPCGIRQSISLQCERHGTLREYAVSGRASDCMSVLGGCGTLCGSMRNCGHICESVCHGKVDCDALSPCTKPCVRVGSACNANRTCTHPCPLQCSQPCGECKVKRVVKCGCGRDVTILCCNKKPAGAFYRECEAKFDAKLGCDHKAKVSCYTFHMEPEKSQCDAVCGRQHPDCHHPCQDKCSNCFTGQDETSQSWQHTPCQHKCTKPLVCGHACQSPCSNLCPPCAKNCEYRCEHHKKGCGNKHKCGQADKCVNCMERCTNGCEHTKCTKLCGQVCDRKPCNERCTEKLPCNHQCRGICGERCLTRCFECQPIDENEDVFFGSEMDEDALFVQLECGHTFEMRDFDHYLEQETDFRGRNISAPCCPRCKRTILYFDGVKRYKALLTKARTAVQAAKMRVVKLEKDLKEQLEIAETKLKKLTSACVKRLHFFANVPTLTTAITEADKLRARIEKIENLQLTASLCQKVFLLDLFYSVTAKLDQAPSATSDGRRGNEEMNRGIKALQEMPSNETTAAMNQLVRDTLVKVIEARNADPYLQLANERPHHSVSIYKNIPIPTNEDLLDITQILADSRPYGLSDEEKRGIMQALSTAGSIQRSGAFRTCVCGYIYAIGDCGGAEQISKCPECNRAIGGTQHRDVDGVRHTGAIDGSHQPAWPQPQAQ